MHSGVDRREFEADIFFDIVYYQCLRHMVSDKFQGCAYYGPQQSIFFNIHKPVKGRKKAGGI